jgi:type III pantothenate kinase
LNKIFEPKNIFKTSSTLRFPFVNAYKTPKTLGVDRMGLMAAAAKTYPKQNVLVIDVGTCITYDVLTQENIYVGGLISPGYTLRYKSLNEFTSKLPLIVHRSKETTLGVDTQSSIQAGVFHGVFHEIQGQIDHFRHKYQDLTIILTVSFLIHLHAETDNSSLFLRVFALSFGDSGIVRRLAVLLQLFISCSIS